MSKGGGLMNNTKQYWGKPKKKKKKYDNTKELRMSKKQAYASFAHLRAEDFIILHGAVRLT